MVKNGELMVSLRTARGIHDNDFLRDVNPYVMLKYTSSQVKVSSVSYAPTVYRTDPWWDDVFYFDTTNGVDVLKIELYENANHKLIGVADIPLDSVFFVNTIPETDYQIFNDHGVYVGDIYVALTFTPHQF
ncbi:16 kDa phloem protein 2-like [Vicia villosa]|uniref:16 kDa phloem protein 2-like n=1 Tax=Vicia villosa TaxID=3911 RepID=UPI00273C4436|nr:16 kDa phloem protein 2-like [Vicia villosa]